MTSSPCQRCKHQLTPEHTGVNTAPVQEVISTVHNLLYKNYCKDKITLRGILGTVISGFIIIMNVNNYRVGKRKRETKEVRG